MNRIAEGTLSKLDIHVWNLKKLLVGRVQSTSRPVWKQSVIEVSSLACSQDFINEDSNLKLNSVANWKSVEVY